MNKPALYSKHASPAIFDYYQNVMENYFPLIRHGTNGTSDKFILDIGCGPGETTHDVILPYVDKEINTIIGVDISASMIDFAQKTYGNERIRFQEVDVAGSLPEEFVERFDYIVSFMAFHWIPDQRKLYSNILKMLKPNGGFLSIYVAKSKVVDIYEEISKNAEYVPYISKAKYNPPPFQKSNDPEKELRSILNEIGFENSYCKMEEVGLPHKTREDSEGYFVSLSPYHDYIPKHMQKKFISDHVDLLDTVTGANGEKEYYVSHNLFLTHGRKASS
ncbi:juvenile hormone acid O-methyltransferase-like [Photinus pyralis]|uniref:juvenile hormone acid O-methyltransferase-like n=1 Tax=Photinus pyralis TaxID=7054 RepID=UPI001267084C|nr:juvenile hormone acid O-methyltransferase-like [Photinus pyralis]XP_031334755.1 juvenile hormone acid O-methyltransferase-like [Photinus pyralis]XP_031334756.1 juvenile hormone acid O-methyltransferase-like [Photinus pyralis]XP_031350678.1 juvenile hormone acid O-methyltransferase-like [Photinus pyralis]